VDRRIRHSLRAGVTVVAATAALSALAYTGQSTDGFIHTNFTGPLSVFGGSPTALPADVLAIGDGLGDAGELAALLKTSARGAGAPLQLSIEAGSTPGSTQVSVLPGSGSGATAPADKAAPTNKASLQVASSPVLNAAGQPDCTAAVSCVTDPVTNAVTVTLANGVVAVVQKVNDMTLVAYKSVGDTLESTVNALSLPGSGLSNTVQALAPQLPVIQLPVPTSAPAAPPMAAAAVVTGPSVDAAPEPATSGIVGGQPSVSPAQGAVPAPALADTPKVTISRAPQDFGLPRVGNPTGTAIAPSNSDAINTVKGAVDSAFNAVKDAVGKIGSNGGGSGDSAPSSSTKQTGRN